MNYWGSTKGAVLNYESDPHFSSSAPFSSMLLKMAYWHYPSFCYRESVQRGLDLVCSSCTQSSEAAALWIRAERTSGAVAYPWNSRPRSSALFALRSLGISVADPQSLCAQWGPRRTEAVLGWGDRQLLGTCQFWSGLFYAVSFPAPPKAFFVLTNMSCNFFTFAEWLFQNRWVAEFSLLMFVLTVEHSCNLCLLTLLACELHHLKPSISWSLTINYYENYLKEAVTD